MKTYQALAMVFVASLFPAALDAEDAKEESKIRILKEKLLQKKDWSEFWIGRRCGYASYVVLADQAATVGGAD
jgi:hypothetical protein